MTVPAPPTPAAAAPPPAPSPSSSSSSPAARPTPESNPKFFGWLSSLSRATGLGLTAASTLEGSSGGRSIKQLEQDEKDWNQCEAWKGYLMEWGALPLPPPRRVLSRC